MNTFMLMGLVIQILILPASVMGYISAGQYMRDSSKLIKNDSKANKKMWILVVILPLLYIVLPILGTYI